MDILTSSNSALMYSPLTASSNSLTTAKIGTTNLAHQAIIIVEVITTIVVNFLLPLETPLYCAGGVNLIYRSVCLCSLISCITVQIMMIKYPSSGMMKLVSTEICSVFSVSYTITISKLSLLLSGENFTPIL